MASSSTSDDAKQQPFLLPRVDIRGGIICEKNRIPATFKPIRWEGPAATSSDAPVSPKTPPRDVEQVSILDEFVSLEKIQERMEKEYGGQSVYEFVTC